MSGSAVLTGPDRHKQALVGADLIRLVTIDRVPYLVVNARWDPRRNAWRSINLALPARLVRFDEDGTEIHYGAPAGVDVITWTEHYRVDSAGGVAFRGPRPWVDVRAYGAMGDGITDDTIAIQAALDQGGTIFVPNGTYIISSTLLIGSNTRLLGQGPLAVLRLKAGANTQILRNADQVGGNASIVVENLTLDGNKAQQTALTGANLNFTKVTDGIIRGVITKDGADSGLWLVDCNHILVHGVTAISNTRTGISIRGNAGAGSTNIVVSNCSARGGIVGIQALDLVVRCVISSCVTELNTGVGGDGSGIEVTMSSPTAPSPLEIAIVGNVVRDNTQGIRVEAKARLISVVGNIAEGSVSHGFFVFSAEMVLLHGNIAQGNSGDGFHVEKAAAFTGPVYATVVGNLARDNTGYGFLTTADLANGIIIGNTAFGNTAGQYSLSGTNLKIRHNEGLVTETSGLAAVTGAVNSVTVAHGLADIPTRVFVQALQSGQGLYWVSARDATTFTISFQTQPGAATWNFDWRAQLGEG